MMTKYFNAVRRSGLEDRIELQLNKLKVPYRYENVADKLQYIVPATQHSYTPDFVIKTNSGKAIIIEAKGIWDRDDRMKHLYLREQHPELDIRFVFSYSKQRISKGSKTTYRDICEGRFPRKPFKGITWKYADKFIPLEWIKE